MPKNARRRQNKLRAQGGQGAPSGSGRSDKKRPRQPRFSLGALFANPTTQWTAIGAAVVAGIVALVVFGLLQSRDKSFAFSMYQGADQLGAEELVGGEDLDFAQLFPAEKPIVLNFWAGLCPPCRAEMPGFQEIYEQFQGDIILLGVGPFMGLGSNGDARNLLRELNITYPTGYAHERAPVSRFNVIAMPTTVFFTPDGKTFRTKRGFLDRGEMGEIVRDLIAASESQKLALAQEGR